MHLKEELQVLVANGKRTTMHESLDIPEDCESEKEREREKERKRERERERVRYSKTQQNI